MIYIIIYLIGYVLVYYLGRYEVKRINDNTDYNYGHVIALLFLSLASWLSFFVILFLRLIDILDKYSNNKPPRWL